jgi:GH15 family glucan-1,4-alpha-glucosidase
MSALDFGLIGNSSIAALINPLAEIVWACLPRFDGDPVFCSLLREPRGEQNSDFGFFTIDLINRTRSEQEYLTNTAILSTRLYDSQGGAVEVTDFAPRFYQHGRVFCPMMIIRRIRRQAGSPLIRLSIRPACGYGAHRPAVTHGSHHIRYVAPDFVLRLTTDASITAIIEETPFYLEDEITLVLGPDETIQDAVSEVGDRFQRETTAYWRQWVRYLSIPFGWQEAVIRAAITLKLNAFDDTGAIIAAMTTSIPEAANSGRNWDYRYCWLRDGYLVVNALNRLGATRTMENFLRYIINIAAGAGDGYLQPVYRIDGRAMIEEREVESLQGYRGMGPVRVGNMAFRQKQHDVYGSAILSATHIFFDKRLSRTGDAMLFRRLETLGEKAVLVFDQPDAGIWELRNLARPHTFSAVMCWAACDRLSRIAAHLGLQAQPSYWRRHADRIHQYICERSWNPHLNSFVSTLDGNGKLDASLLLLHEIGFLSAEDPRFAGTVTAIERELRHGDFIFRYAEADDYGVPENAFLVCTFWYIYALAALGRSEEARDLFEKLLSRRSLHGLLAEHIDPHTGEQWGNFPQTYSMVGLINSAIRLSIRWDQAF